MIKHLVNGENILHSEGHPERFTELHGEEKRKEGERGDQEERKVKSLSRVQLCDPVDCSPPGSSIHGILQARILEWVAISFSRGSSWPRNQTHVSRIAGRRFNLWATREALMTTGKTIALTRQTFVGKVMSLLFNMLSRLTYTGICFVAFSKRSLFSPSSLKPYYISH